MKETKVVYSVVCVLLKVLNPETGHDFSEMRKIVYRGYDSQHWRGS
jgi:hypothetical protein